MSKTNLYVASAVAVGALLILLPLVTFADSNIFQSAPLTAMQSERLPDFTAQYSSSGLGLTGSDVQVLVISIIVAFIAYFVFRRKFVISEKPRFNLPPF